MADNTTITSGAASTLPDGTIIATDQASSDNSHMQIIKLAYSADGVKTPVQADVNGMLVQIGSGSVTATGSLSLTGATTGGLSIYNNVDLDETKVAMKASAGTVYGWHLVNLTAADLFFKLWDVASGSVTVGTTAPTLVIPVPVSSTVHGGVTVSIPAGLAFATAITIACVTGVTTAGSSGPATNGFTAAVWYK